MEIVKEFFTGEYATDETPTEKTRQLYILFCFSSFFFFLIGLGLAVCGTICGWTFWDWKI